MISLQKPLPFVTTVTSTVKCFLFSFYDWVSVDARWFLNPLSLIFFCFLELCISRSEIQKMLACFTDHRGLCRATAIGYLLLLLFCFFISISTSCSNGNCQVPFFFISFSFHILFPFVIRSIWTEFLENFADFGFMFTGYRLWSRSLLWKLPCFGQDSTFLY